MTAPTTTLYDRIHAEFMEKAQDPTWRFAMQVFIGELMQENAVYHQAPIQAICDWAAERQLNRHKTAITKRYITERLVEINKARKDHHGFQDWATGGPKPTARPSGYNGFNDTMWERSANGRFARYVGPSHVKADFWNRKGGKVVEPHERGIRADPGDSPRPVISQAIARRSEAERAHPASAFGLLNTPEELPAGVSQSQHSIDVAHAFDRMTYALANMTGDSKDKQRVQFVISSPDGYHRVETPEPGKMPQQLDYARGERVSFMTPVGPDNPVSIAGKAVNIGHVAGMSPEEAAKAGAVAGDVHGALTKASWGDKLQHSANAMRVMSNDSPLAVQAHAVASLFNILGPDASRAFGNKLKQLTYRYTGMEVAPANYSPVARKGRQVDAQGRIQGVRDYERQLARDLVPAIPSSTEYNLALQAGSSPPSRGYILNSDGRVVSEAVGYADDWYTPFNLKKLPQMSGGSYIRTRGYGGLTPEDIRLAMRARAKRVTVISNNGVFTMEFEPKALHWGHRFGFVGNGMIKRYAKALDAIQGGEVDQIGGALGDEKTLDGKPKAGKLKLNTQGYLVAMKDLQRKNPNWIVADSDQVPFHQNLREFGNIDRAEVTGDEAKDKGYMGPLNIHADSASGGWADKSVKDASTDPDGKFLWSTVDRGRMHSDLGLGLINKLTGNSATTKPFTASNGGSGGLGGLGNASRSGSTETTTNAQGHRVNSDGHRVNVHGISERQIRVDSERLLRDYTGNIVDHTGKKITWSEGKRLRDGVYAAGNPEYTVQGNVFYKGDDISSSRPTADSNPVSLAPGAGGVPMKTYEREFQDRSNHWDPDEAVSVAQDVRNHLIRLHALGHLPKDTSRYKGLDLARRATLDKPDGQYQHTQEYADFVDKLTVSPTYRKLLASDLDDTIDGQHLSDEFTHLEPGQLLATLREKEYDPKAVSPRHPEPAEDERGDNYESLDINAETPLTMTQLSSPFIKEHAKGLERRSRDERLSDAEKDRASNELREYREYARMVDKIDKQRQRDSDARRPLSEAREVLKNERPGMIELYHRLNATYAQMLQHGVQVEHENPGYVPKRVGKGTEEVPATPYVVDESAGVLPNFEELLAGHLDAEQVGEGIYNDVADEDSEPHQKTAKLKKLSRQYNSAAASLKSQNPEASRRFKQVYYHLQGYLPEGQRDS